ncbi:MAG: phosphopyruvate hydratase [Candidatus Helarchaeota archaeon]
MTDRYLIKKIRARWILDSRGFPTIETDVITEDGVVGRAAVPSGASTGEHEVLELRDRNNRFMGRGVNKAIENVNLKIAKLLLNQNVLDQSSLDQSMIELDGTKNKSNLGGNAILSVSLAIADAAAKELNIELFEYLYKIYRENDVPSIKYVLPVPMSNVLNGGKHAGNNLSVQEFMIVPFGASSFKEAIIMISEVYHYLRNRIKEKFGKSAINLGDEGGFAPNLSFTKDALNLLIDAIEESGYNKGKEISIAIDAAASEFYNGSKYLIDEKRLSIEELIDYYIDLVKTYPIISIEDPFDENDFQAHSKLMSKINIQIVGDDLFVTQVDRIKRGIEEKSANALLLKVNQVGTLTEALNSAKLCQKNNFNVIVSHRSGETENTFISDLAVGLSFNRGLIKAGAPARSERTAKYNRILRIEEKIQNSIYSGKNFK